MNRDFLPPFLTKLSYFLGKLSVRLRARQNHQPIPGHCYVIRLARPSKNFKETRRVSAIDLDIDFRLTSLDEESTPPHLNVWAEVLTTPQQAYSFLPENFSEKKLVLRLKTEEIRFISCSLSEQQFPDQLSVLWVHLFEEDKQTRDYRTGAEGHAGIVGLAETQTPEGLSKKQAKNLRKSLRAQLTELASRDCYLLLED